LRESKSGLSELQCPYHHWTYALDGTLKAAPFFNGPTSKPIGRLNTLKNGLVPVLIGVWHQFVFVNLSGETPPLEDYLAPLSDLYAGYDLDSLRAGYTMTVEIKSNWKLLPDNWENYHWAYLHGKFFEMQDFFKEDKLTCEGEVSDCCMANVTPVGSPRRRKAVFPLIPGPPKAERRGLSTHVFPMTLPHDHFAPVIYTPIAPDRTQAKMVWFFVGDAATSSEYAEASEKCVDRWFGKSRRIEGLDDVRNEDYDLMQTQ
jgi:choline monooxygenase